MNLRYFINDELYKEKYEAMEENNIRSFSRKINVIKNHELNETEVLMTTKVLAKNFPIFGESSFIKYIYVFKVIDGEINCIEDFNDLTLKPLFGISTGYTDSIYCLDNMGEVGIDYSTGIFNYDEKILSYVYSAFVGNKVFHLDVPEPNSVAVSFSEGSYPYDSKYRKYPSIIKGEDLIRRGKTKISLHASKTEKWHSMRNNPNKGLVLYDDVMTQAHRSFLTEKYMLDRVIMNLEKVYLNSTLNSFTLLHDAFVETGVSSLEIPFDKRPVNYINKNIKTIVSDFKREVDRIERRFGKTRIYLNMGEDFHTLKCKFYNDNNSIGIRVDRVENLNDYVSNYIYRDRLYRDIESFKREHDIPEMTYYGNNKHNEPILFKGVL